MSILQKNPFRILGLFGNSSEREIQKQIGIIKRYAEIDKFKSFEYDFEFIGDLSRTLEDIQQAAGKIEQAQKKLHYSVFWFIKHTKFDEIALNQLKSHNIDKAIEIWDKTIKEVSGKNFSSYMNLSTLFLALSIINDQIELQHLQKAIELKGKLIHSDFIHNYTSSVTGNGINIDSTTLSKNLAEEIIELLKPHLNKKGGITTKELISLFDSYPSNIQKYITDKFTETPVSNIENNIDKTANKRKNHPENADEFGEILYKTTKNDINSLKKILGKNNVQFQMIANKLASELLQCSIEFFNIHREKEDFDPGDRAIKIAKYAGSIGATGQVKERIDENSRIIQEWVDDKPDRKKQEAVLKEIAFIEKKCIWFDGAADSIENAKELITSCKPKLTVIGKTLGINDDYYMKISSLIVHIALNMIIEVINKIQDLLKYDQTMIFNLPSTFSSAIKVLDQMDSFDMTKDVRKRLDKNYEIISDTYNQLLTITRNASGARQTSSSSGGCYIATMVYGDYDHPYVKILRNFRDENLAATLPGKFLIRLYYTFSPHLVSILKGNRIINKVLRIILDKLINHLNR